MTNDNTPPPNIQQFILNMNIKECKKSNIHNKSVHLLKVSLCLFGKIISLTHPDPNNILYIQKHQLELFYPREM